MGLIFLLLICGAAWFLVPFAWRKRQEVRLDEVCRAQGLVALTYDDGPGQALTGKLIDLFKRHGVRATFFVLGKNADLRPDVVRDLVAAGHDVGHHTQDHSNAWKCGPLRMSRDLGAGIDTITALGGDKTLFRPPYGKVTIAGLFDGARKGLTHAFWTVDTQDSWKRRPLDEVMAEIESRGGGVILMHDYDVYKDEGDQPHADYVVEASERIIQFAQEKGLKLVPFSEIKL
jgi:peptidoglycan/xylan/chitin deacetylase (PgdA/CDA1 family)